MIQGRGKQRTVGGRGKQRPYAVVPDIESLPSRTATLYRRLTE